MSDIPPPFDAAWFRFFLGFLIGAALGSFATMLAYRLPRRMSIIRPGSHCPTCGAKLRVRDLVPIASWIAHRGRCGLCAAAIGVRYLWIELGASFACGVASVVIGVSPWLVVAYAVIVAVIVKVAAYL